MLFDCVLSPSCLEQWYVYLQFFFFSVSPLHRVQRGTLPIKEQQEAEQAEAPIEFEPIKADDLINDAPPESKAVRVTDFFFGRIPVGINLDDSKKDWKRPIFLCLLIRARFKSTTRFA